MAEKYTRFKRTSDANFSPGKGEWKKRIIGTGKPQIVVSCPACGTCSALADVLVAERGAHGVVDALSMFRCWSCKFQGPKILMEQFYAMGKICIPATCPECAAPRIWAPLEMHDGREGEPYLCGAWYTFGDPPEEEVACPSLGGSWWTQDRITRFVNGRCPISDHLLRYRMEMDVLGCTSTCRFQIATETAQTLMEQCLQSGYAPGKSPAMLKFLPPAEPAIPAVSVLPLIDKTVSMDSMFPAISGVMAGKKTAVPDSPFVVDKAGKIKSVDSKSVVAQAFEKMLTSGGSSWPDWITDDNVTDYLKPKIIQAATDHLAADAEKAFSEKFLMSATKKESVEKIKETIGMSKDALISDEFTMTDYSADTNSLLAKHGSPPAGVSFKEHMEMIKHTEAAEQQKMLKKALDAMSGHLSGIDAALGLPPNEPQPTKEKPKRISKKKFGGPTTRKLYPPKEDGDA